jgi:SAM-dependent methyltransferase
VQSFYDRVVSQLIESGQLDRSSRVLVVCGGDRDKQVFQRAGLTEVTISNVDDRVQENAFAPFYWSFQDAEQLTFSDAEFDVVAVHAGLHHCRSPHRALLEMYRVAKRGVLVIEARDSWSMRRATQLGVALDYEIPAVSANNWTHGGVGNGPIPNYVYRWTEREVEKTLASVNPEGKQRCRYFYGLELPYEVVAMQGRSKLALLKALAMPLKAVTWALPSQGNCFAFWVDKPQFPADLQPWLTMDGDAIVPKRS